MKLSIITVNLNNLEGLKKTYESVVSQTFTDYEWLVIDGGSTDGSREFIEQHQDKFDYWCSEPDKGIYNAMKDKVCWFDLYSDTFPHQASFIRRTLFDLVGLYDEELKVVSASRWFAMAILNYGATYKFLPYKIAIFEGKGLCQTSDFSSEKPKQRDGIFPDYITDEDILNLTVMSIIQTTRLTKFLLTLVKIIAFQIKKKKKKQAIRQFSLR